MLLYWTGFVVKLPDIENSFVTEKYGEGIIIHGDRKEVVKMRERGRWVTSICTFSNKVWSGHVAEPSGELCLCGWNNKGGILSMRGRVNTLLSRAIFAEDHSRVFCAFLPPLTSLSFPFSLFLFSQISPWIRIDGETMTRFANNAS